MGHYASEMDYEDREHDELCQLRSKGWKEVKRFPGLSKYEYRILKGIYIVSPSVAEIICIEEGNDIFR